MTPRAHDCQVYPIWIDEWIQNVKSIKVISEQAESFVNNINKYKNFIKIIKNYVTFNVNLLKNKENKKETKENKKEENIVFSGFRDKNLKQILEENGHIVNDNVTKETTIVVYNEDDTSSKCQKAKKIGIKLIQKNNILNLLNI